MDSKGAALVRVERTLSLFMFTLMEVAVLSRD
jgi:hypothetical protein